MNNKNFSPSTVDRTLEVFLKKNIIILDTCVCRALSRTKESSYWFSIFKEMKSDGVEFCLSDVAMVELIKQFNNDQIKKNEWKMIFRKLKDILSDTLPVFVGKGQLYHMANIFDIENSKEFDFIVETKYSLAKFNFLLNCKTKTDLTTCNEILFNIDEKKFKITPNINDANKILEEERNYWIEHVNRNGNLIKEDRKKIFLGNKCDENMIDSFENNRNLAIQIVNDQFESICEILREELDRNLNSSPKASVRMDLLIKYLTNIVLRRAKGVEKYNPYSRKKKNDGLDFLVIMPLILPARICTLDGINNIKEIMSYQKDWILSPDSIVNLWQDKKLQTLSFPSE